MPARRNAPRINRSHLIARIVRHQLHLSPRDVDEAVKLIFDRVAHALAEHDRVELRGFGSFSLRSRRPRMARNPKTGDRVVLNRRYVPHFKPGKVLREKLSTHFQ